ncbi:hypothetical protein CIG1485E_a0018 (plasmid) [Campylobacter iguaniorum]|uniref:Uncharacterized protein n=1 Tax=Campylobacter iguaniorum TaxID=1244531 RepID=A0A076FD19_9BACT|nr:hypothetical protein [Campylobacter iguaniorum]AII15543.1 hypothetical protein CIG1485E_a0018 [Campylobacter iguaniorum]
MTKSQIRSRFYSILSDMLEDGATPDDIEETINEMSSEGIQNILENIQSELENLENMEREYNKEQSNGK